MSNINIKGILSYNLLKKRSINKGYSVSSIEVILIELALER